MRPTRAFVFSLVAALACHRAQRVLTSAQPDSGFSRPLSGQGVYTGDRRPASFPDAGPHKAGRAATFG